MEPALKGKDEGGRMKYRAAASTPPLDCFVLLLTLSASDGRIPEMLRPRTIQNYRDGIGSHVYRRIGCANRSCVAAGMELRPAMLE